MHILVILSQVALYVSFAILFGTFLLKLVPNAYRPAFDVPRKLLYSALTGVLLGSFLPALYVIVFIAPRIGIAQAIVNVFTVYTVGQSFLLCVAISVVLYLCISFMEQANQTYVNVVALLLTILQVATVAWSSHASSVNIALGFTSDFVHLLFVSIWVGIVFILAFYAKDATNWLAFLKWFTPVAALCFTFVALSGLFIMNTMIPSYVNSWAVSYGQGLLIKHLIILPLAFYALMNGVFVKERIKLNASFDPIRWAKIESILLLAIFCATAFFSQQSPPMHMVSTTEITPMFKWFYDGQITSNFVVHLGITWFTLLFFILTFVTFVLSIIAFIKKAPMYVSLLLAFFMVVCAYLTVMHSII